MGNIGIAWLEVSEPELLPEIEKALIEWFEPPLNRASIFSEVGKNTSRVQTVLPNEALEKLKVIAKEQDRSVSYLIALAVQEWLNQREEKEG